MSNYDQFVATKEDKEKIEDLAVSWIRKLDGEGEHSHSVSLIAYLIFHNAKGLSMAHIDIYTLIHYLTMSCNSRLTTVAQEYPEDERNLIIREA